MIGNIALITSGICAIVVALYHGIMGDALVQNMSIEPAESKALMRGSFHIGTMGWLVGGLVILFVTTLDPNWVRTSILLAYVALFGIPAASLIIMERGRPNFGMTMLCLIVIGLIIGLVA
ncbi:MAG: hypothetical protein AAGD96_01160 [Chloroflexota bacterium]